MDDHRPSLDPPTPPDHGFSNFIKMLRALNHGPMPFELMTDAEQRDAVAHGRRLLRRWNALALSAKFN